MDELDEVALVLEHVTLTILSAFMSPPPPPFHLALHVENVVEMLVDLFLLPVLGQEAAENTLATHPDDLGGETSLSGTLALTEAHVSSLPLRLVLSVHAGAGVDRDGLADNVTVLHQLADVLAGVGHGDLVDLIRVKPDLTLAALEHGGSKALLQPEGNHAEQEASEREQSSGFLGASLTQTTSCLL